MPRFSDAEIQGVAPDMFGIFNDRLPYQFHESLKTLYLLQKNKGREFYPHAMHAFVRFDREQIKNIKHCQLQVALMNVGQLKTVDRRFSVVNTMYLNEAILPGLDAPFSTWDPRVSDFFFRPTSVLHRFSCVL